MLKVLRGTTVLSVFLATAVAFAGPSQDPVIELHAGPNTSREVKVEAFWFDPLELDENETAQDVDAAGEPWNGAVSLNRPGSFSEATQVSRVSDFTIEGKGSAYASASTYQVDFGGGYVEDRVGYSDALSELRMEFSVPVHAEFTLGVRFKFKGSNVSNATAVGAIGLAGLGIDESDCPHPFHAVAPEDPGTWTLGCTGTAIADQTIVVSARVDANSLQDVPGDVSGSFEIFLSFVEVQPTINDIVIESVGISPEDPETGKYVVLHADLTTPFPFEIRSCTWTGNNFTGPGIGDKDNSCWWKYKPQKGAGPKRDTYGDKNLTLTVVYDYDTYESATEVARTEDYKVFFSKKGDDDSNSQPNWFDYWGEDGAVPGLDDANVRYQAGISSIAEAQGSVVTFGARGGDADGSTTVPATPDCPGGLFPGAKGIDLAAISLAHERKHIALDALGGTDTDGDDVPDTAEDGTSPTNPDSCNLAGVIHSDYATYGDHEFIARRAELGVSGVALNDWAVPGRQAKMQTPGSIARLSETKNSNQTQSYSGFRAGTITPQGVGATLTNSYSATVNDSDGDTLNNSMTVHVDVNAAEPGDYSVSAWLSDDSDEPLIGAAQDVALGAGSATVEVQFDGPALERLGVSQPFKVSRVEFYARVGKHLVLQDAADDVLVTGYDSADFDPPAATLTSVLSESAVDAGVDGLFDSLDITVEIAIHEPGQYEVSGQLRGTRLSLAASQTINAAQDGVTEQVILSFSGPGVFYYRESGPWTVTHLDLVSGSDGALLDSMVDAWSTAAFQHTEFQQAGNVFDETSYSDSGGELDEDGKLATLDVMVSIVASVPGVYRLLASLEDDRGNTIANASRLVGLAGTEHAAEANVTQIQFNGTDISASGIDGPWRLAGVTLISAEGTVIDQNPLPYTTSAYTHDQFSDAPGGPEELLFDDGFE